MLNLAAIKWQNKVVTVWESKKAQHKQPSHFHYLYSHNYISQKNICKVLISGLLNGIYDDISYLKKL